MNIENKLLLILIFFEIIFLLSISYKLLNKKNVIFILFEPIIGFIIGSLIIYLLIPFFMIYFNVKFFYFENYSTINYFYSNLISFSYIIFVIVFYLIFNNKLNLKRRLNFSLCELKKIEILSIFIFIFIPILISTLILTKDILSYGLKQYFNNRIVLRRGKGILVLLSYMSTIFIPIIQTNILLLIKKNKLKNIHFKLFNIFITIPFIISYILMGNRLPAFIIIILSLFNYWIIYLNKLTFRYILKIIFIFLFLILIFTFSGFYRFARGDIDKISEKYIKNLYINIFEYSIIKNFGNHDHLVWLLKYNNRWEPLYGETYIAGILNFIPRKIYPEKLLGGGPHLKNIMSPGSYSLYKKNITSYTTGVIIEAYMNFKYFGIIIISFLHSLILIFLKKFSFNFNSNIILFIIYLYLFFTFSFLILFTEFLGIFSKTIFFTVPFIVFYYFFNNIYLFWRENKRGK
ncbi:O-antigen polymerase [Calditrichota bacterium GD2]